MTKGIVFEECVVYKMAVVNGMAMRWDMIQQIVPVLLVSSCDEGFNHPNPKSILLLVEYYFIK